MSTAEQKGLELKQLSRKTQSYLNPIKIMTDMCCAVIISTVVQIKLSYPCKVFGFVIRYTVDTDWYPDHY